jgi:homoserine dehydrogenase
VRLTVEDTPGVLAQVAKVLGDRGIGISSVIQPEEPGGDTTPLILMLDDASLRTVREAIKELRGLACVREEPSWMRVETLER